MDWKHALVKSFLDEYEWEKLQQECCDFYRFNRRLILVFLFSDITLDGTNINITDLSEDLVEELIVCLAEEMRTHKREYLKVWHALPKPSLGDGSMDTKLQKLVQQVLM